MGFVWQEAGSGDPHQPARLPGRTKVPICRDTESSAARRRDQGAVLRRSEGMKTIGGYRVQRYTVNQDADQWHLLYAWTRGGTLYTLSEHIAPPLTMSMIVRNLDRMMGALVLLKPA